MEGDKEGGRVHWRGGWQRRGREIWRKILEEFWASGLVVGTLGSRARKSNFLELGSWRGYVPSWLGGNNFRHAVLGSFRKAIAAGQPPSSRGTSLLLLFTVIHYKLLIYVIFFTSKR
jgi:hypothetical protein